MSDPRYDHLIIGGGISGLGLAHLSARAGLQTRVLESEGRLGGCIHSHVFPEAGGFWLELGSHTCYNSYSHLLDMIADLGLVHNLREKAKVRFKLLGPEGLSSVFSRLHPLELALSLPRLFTEKKRGRSVWQYYSRVLGRRNYRDLFGPAFSAVICQPAQDFPAELLFRRKQRRKQMPRSFTLPHGLSSIPTAIAGQSGLEVVTGQAATGLVKEADGFRVQVADGPELHARHLSLALPPDRAASLLAGPFPQLASQLGAIHMAEIDSVGVAVARDALGLEPLAGIIAADDTFYAAVARDYLEDPAYRGLCFHFRPNARDPDSQIRRICQVLGIGRDAVAGTARRRNRLPALRTGHQEILRAIDDLLPGSGLGLTGNYFFGVSIEDCLTRSAAEHERLFGT
jgi:oxygen-dependent protoporphyrinogen oxidase